MAAGNVMMREQFADLFFSRLPYLDEIIYENFDAPSLTYPLVFQVKNSSRMREQTTGVTGFDLFSTQADGDKVEYDALLQAHDKTFTHSKYGKGFQISEDTAEDDIDGVITDAAPALGRVAQVSIETVIWNVFNNGFTTEQSPDGVSVFNANHVLRGGGTFNNLVSGDLSVANLESAINIFDDMRDERNVLIETAPSALVIPPELRWVAHEILRSELRSDTANNATNAFNQIGMRVIMSKYLTGATDWFVLMPKERMKFIVYWRRRPVTDHALDFDTGNMKTKMTYRFSVGVADWRGAVGAQGS